MRELADEVRAWAAWVVDSGLQNLASGLGPRASAPAMKLPTLEAVRDQMGECTLCKLHKGRHNIVFGVGNPRARLMFVGEAQAKTKTCRDFRSWGRPGSS